MADPIDMSRIFVIIPAVRDALIVYANASTNLLADQKAVMTAKLQECVDLWPDYTRIEPILRDTVTGVPDLRARVAAFGKSAKAESHLVGKQVAILNNKAFGPGEWSKGNRYLNAVRALPGGEDGYMKYNNLALSIIGGVGAAAVARDVTNASTLTTRPRQKYYFSI